MSQVLNGNIQEGKATRETCPKTLLPATPPTRFCSCPPPAWPLLSLGSGPFRRMGSREERSLRVRTLLPAAKSQRPGHWLFSSCAVTSSVKLLPATYTHTKSAIYIFNMATKTSTFHDPTPSKTFSSSA